MSLAVLHHHACTIIIQKESQVYKVLFCHLNIKWHADLQCTWTTTEVLTLGCLHEFSTMYMKHGSWLSSKVSQQRSPEF